MLSPRASISDSCETLLMPRIRPLLGGFVRYQTCWFWVVCRSRSPSWLETATVTQLSGLLSGEDPCKSARNPLVSPIATNQKPRCIFDSVQTASRGTGNTARSGVCTLSDVRFLGCVVQCGSRIDSCETGFEGAQKAAAEGVLQLSDVLPVGSVGSAGLGPAGREVGVVKRGDAKADPGSPKKTRVGFG